MCLSIIVDYPDLEIESGKIENFEYVITGNPIGFRCGYLKLLPGHPWYSKGYYDFDANVHGGITFTEADKPCDKNGSDNGWWIGFDCNHTWDDLDPHLIDSSSHNVKSSKVRSTDYVRSELISLAQQASLAISE